VVVAEADPGQDDRKKLSHIVWRLQRALHSLPPSCRLICSAEHCLEFSCSQLSLRSYISCGVVHTSARHPPAQQRPPRGPWPPLGPACMAPLAPCPSSRTTLASSTTPTARRLRRLPPSQPLRAAAPAALPSLSGSASTGEQRLCLLQSLSLHPI
jgi:hypothetical protein